MAQRDQVRRMGKTVHDIMAGDPFLDAIAEAASDENTLAQLKANPKAHLQGKVRGIPDEMKVEFREGPPWRIRLGLSGEGVRYHCEVRSGDRGPETHRVDRARFRVLAKQVHDNMASDAFLDALEETARDQKALAALRANPRAHLQSKGLSIPDEVDVEVTEGSLCLCKCWDLKNIRFCLCFCIG